MDHSATSTSAGDLFAGCGEIGALVRSIVRAVQPRPGDERRAMHAGFDARVAEPPVPERLEAPLWNAPAESG